MVSLAEVTPFVTADRRLDDLSKSKLSVRDVVLIVVGAMTMYGMQIGAQWGMRSDIRNLQTSFDSYVLRQTDTNGVLQRQIDEWRQQTKLNEYNVSETQKEVSELKGMLVGAGVKPTPKP